MHFLCNYQSAISTCDPNLHKKPKRYSYTHLQNATNNFSQTTLLGKGSQGAVYRAVIDNATLTAAVKISTSSVTETADNELRILSNIRTPCIVNIIGYAVNSNVSPQKLLLVVEYMPNGSLYDLLHVKPNPPGFLNRVRFLLQVAKAGRTLHGSDPPIMHRDIKSSNVLIDEKGNARLSDFGLAIKGHVSDARVMSTPPAGTLGYLDPCYLAPGDLSTKSDVFSFGILLFEVISGRKAIDVQFSPPYIIEWALPLIKSGGYMAIIDRRISGWKEINPTVVKELCLLGVRCVRSTAEKRPCVKEIVECLKKVYRRVKHKGLDDIWRNLRRRVRGVDRFWPLDDDFDVTDCCEESMRSACEGNQTVKIRSRSKSIGSYREIAKVGPDMLDVVRKKVYHKRSMSVFYGGKNEAQVNKELEVFPLLVNSKGSKTQSCK